MKKIILVLFFGAVVLFGWYKYSLRPVGTRSDDRILVKVEQGMSVSQILDLLHEKRVLRSPLAFKIFVKLNNKESALQAGKFVLRPSMDAAELLDVLQSGKAEEMLITIPEGYSLREIDELLATKGLIEGGELVACATSCDFSSFEFLPSVPEALPRGGKIEGFLFPDTYYVEAENFVPKFFLERLMTTFRKNVIDQYSDQIESSGRSILQLVTMASLIEKETRTDDERGVVSGILWKRYDDGRGLGVDATVRYIFDNRTDPITVSELNDNSPYNTRKFRGLPPGPIANPGLESIKAALEPVESQYWYYLHGRDGKIRYAVTNEEHNINRMNYLN